MRRALALAACALAAGCGGSGQRAANSTRTSRTSADPPRSSIEISLHGRDLRTVVFDQPLTLTGVVRRSQEAAAPLRVRLLADAAPVQSAEAGASGSFAFTVRPRLNTTYSVAAEGSVSRHVRVRALRDEPSGGEPTGRGRGVFVYEIWHPAEVGPTRQPVQFYAHLVGRG